MRRCQGLLLMLAFAGTAVPAHAQGILIGPYPNYAYRGPIGIRVSGFVRAPYGYSTSVTRIQIVVVAPPIFIPRLHLSSDEPPDVLPDVPVTRIRRDLPKIDPPLPAVPLEVPRKPVPKVPALADDPREQSQRQVRLGKESFKTEEYGRAVLRFREASRLQPKAAMPNFLLAQALVALGKYHEAIDAILAGMENQPDWPAARFQPIDLYGDRFAEYPEHLLRLDEALMKHPNDAVLLFLNAYQVWFAGRKDDAAGLFKKALDKLAGKPGTERQRKACERFLRELAPVAKL